MTKSLRVRGWRIAVGAVVACGIAACDSPTTPSLSEELLTSDIQPMHSTAGVPAVDSAAWDANGVLEFIDDEGNHQKWQRFGTSTAPHTITFEVNGVAAGAVKLEYSGSASDSVKHFENQSGSTPIAVMDQDGDPIWDAEFDEECDPELELDCSCDPEVDGGPGGGDGGDGCEETLQSLTWVGPVALSSASDPCPEEMEEAREAWVDAAGDAVSGGLQGLAGGIVAAAGVSTGHPVVAAIGAGFGLHGIGRMLGGIGKAAAQTVDAAIKCNWSSLD